ncbi:MAG: hypothetical protein R3B40_09070 [Polyangiales bacterium]|nr:hypothetical protein [Myxococcales bacterium]MCB9656242.1 hypothetical protein [Sandaracinaceae bacterium]
MLAPLALLVGGCVGSIDDAEQFGPAPECRINLDVEDMFRQRCGTGTCHGNETDDPAAELDLVSPDPGLRIVGTMSTQCDGLMRINPARPDDSFLLEKLEGTPREGCGDRMPLVGYLDQAEIACVRDWVREQARRHQLLDAGVADVGTADMNAADLGTDDGGTP